MGQRAWLDEYTNHSVWQVISDTIDQISSLEVPEEFVDGLNRIQATLSIVLGWREAPTLLVSGSLLDTLQHALAVGTKSQLDNWQNITRPIHLKYAIDNFESVMTELRGWPVTKDRVSRSVIAAMRAAIQESEDRLKSLTDAIAAAKVDLDYRVASLGTKLGEVQAAADEQLLTLTQNVEAAQTTLDQILSKEDQINARLDVVITGHSDTFTTAETTRAAKHVELLDSERERFRQALDAAVKESATSLEGQEASGQEVLARLEVLKGEAEAVVGAVGTAGTANWYQDHADAQEIGADTWRWIAVAGFALAFLVSIFWIAYLDNEDDSWRATLVKGTLSFSLIAVASYAIRESSKHREEELRARTIELKLRALSPFIATLSDAKREKLIQDMAQKVFIGDDIVQPLAQAETEEFLA